jgi:hypothetical protein
VRVGHVRQPDEERERDKLDIEVEEQRLRFYAVVEQLRER